MKKTLLIVAILAAMCLLSSCGMLGGMSTTTTTQATKGGTTTAPSPDTAPPSLAELDSVLEVASPARIRLSLTSHHEGMGALDTDCYMLFGEQDSYYYYYASQYFLPLTEALESGKVVGVRTGYLLASGSTIKATSAEIDNALLTALRDYSIRMPSLREELFEEYEIKRQGELVILSVIAKQGTAGLIFDELLDGGRELAFTVTFAKGLVPIASTVEMTAKDGTPIRYTAAYSYTPAPLPTSDTAASPNLALWE